ncbi:hypothetical protein DEU56DRAFT_974984 [Suillus clintonianus]|uniref:uncharacterized protein n=1 Tax=Suillus clintonianus TaxID=1904413 RepID=UPI001B861033|nr:uncharacterized protein DEU56DRAFT_974984 [Suillus clintonianus]KAG2116276.1 hypothetical protein DEU56DRAFT_974984 [Suillus clintonianus]
MTRIPCCIPGCKRIFKNKSGHTQHMRTMHPKPLRSRSTFHQAAPPAPRSPSPGHHHFDDLPLPNVDDAPENVGDGFMPEEGTCVQLGPLFRAFHPRLTGLKCDINGDFIDQNAPPTPRTEALSTDWTPYDSRVGFETAEFLFTRNQMSARQIDSLLDLWAATLIKHQDSPPFSGHRDLYDTIDATPLGELAWESFTMSYNGIKPAEDVPPWMTGTYEVWFRDPRLLVHNILANPDFDGEIEYVPYRDYNDNDQRCFKNFFSGDWAWNQADTITEDPELHGSTFVPLIVGSDKTTVSVATGHTEYHPLYLSIGNIFNSVRRAHRNGVVLAGFLAIPKSTKEYLEDLDFRDFRRQLFHCSIARIFESLKPNMTVPDIVRCPDGHYRRVIYGLGPYIADYPEQVLLSGVVSRWCPKCLNHRKNLDGDGPSLLRCREHTDLLVQELDHNKLWFEYGIVDHVVPFTNDFPRADIHELLAPDLLHQIIKGTFKDHLVTWVGQYLEHVHGASRAAEILDDIDQRIAAVAPFAGLRRFPEGRGFNQWTGDDSKALMKVYLPAIKGHVPQDVVRTFSAFLDFCYIVRREVLMEDDLVQLQDALNNFHQYREVFKTTGVILTFSLPRQHSMQHYCLMIRRFGAPNGLCSSITESKHIKAVKEPWRRSNRYKALGQMLLTNQRLDKIAAARSDFEARGMLQGSCISDALRGEAGDIIDGPTIQAHVDLAANPVSGGARDVSALALDLELPTFPTMLQQFLHDQIHIADPEPPVFDPATAPVFMGRVSLFSSAAASFYAPSDLSGTGGMRREQIRATHSWRGGPPRNDCVFINMNDNLNCGMEGLAVARVLRFFAFKYRTQYFQCAAVRWFSYTANGRDPDTGMFVVVPSINDDDTPDISIIHIDCIVRAAHLIPVYGANFVSRDITLHDSYNVFRAYYINKYADHHAFEVA